VLKKGANKLIDLGTTSAQLRKVLQWNKVKDYYLEVKWKIKQVEVYRVTVTNTHGYALGRIN